MPRGDDAGAGGDAAGVDPYTGLDRDALLAVVRDLLIERDELAQGLPVGFYTGWFDADTETFQYEYASPRAAELFGVSAAELRADWRAMLQNVHPDDRAALEFEATAVTVPGDEVDWTGRVTVDGTERWVHVNSREYESRPGRWLGVMADVTERKRLEMELTGLARTDHLTGLGNRRHFEESAEALLAQWRRHGGPLSVVLIDLDNFKVVNDSFGHRAGDDALREVGRILAEHGRESDVVARMGGDEFAILMPWTDGDEARAAATRIAAHVESRKGAVPHLGPITLSIGIVVLSERVGAEDESTDAILHRADQALYRAKAAGRNAIEVSDRP